MGKDHHHKRVSDLESRFASIQQGFDACSSSIQNQQFLCLTDLAKATRRAVSSLKTLVPHLDGSLPSSTTSSALEEAKTAWFAVNSCGEACCHTTKKYHDTVLSYGDDLEKWSDEAKTVDAELRLNLGTAQKDVRTETASLRRHQEEMEVAKCAVDEMSRDNMEVQRKYFQVREWASSFPTAWDFQQKLQIVVQARERSLKQAEANLDKSKVRVNKAEAKLDSYKSRLETVSALARKVVGIQAKGHALSRRYRAIGAGAADALGAMNSLKTAYRDAVDLVGMMSIGMYRLESAKYLLGIVDAALDDCTLADELAGLVHYMELRYDTSGRVHSITTPEHPYGLLSGVQRKLREQKAGASPSHAFGMYPIRDVSAKSLATLNVDMVRSILFSLDSDGYRPLRVDPCRIGRGELTDMLRNNIRMTWDDAL